MLKGWFRPRMLRLITLHGEFVQSQMQLLTEQARILGEVSSKTAMDAAKSKS